MSETVSIIIPVYRAADTVERCVESLVRGTYPELEIILVEDCSPDESWEVCQKLQARYPCVKAYRNAGNSGPSASRNRGLQEMTGKFLMFVDSDDWVEPDFAASFVNAWKQYQPDLIACGYWNHDEVQNASTDYFGWDGEAEVSATDLKPALLPMYEGRLLQQIWNKFFLADVVRQNRLRFDTSIRMGEDFRFLLSYLELIPGVRLVRINRPLYHYIRSSGNSLMSRFGQEKIDEPLRNLDRLYSLLEMDAREKQERLSRDRETQVELWAYLIMHNMGMSSGEKKKLILSLDPLRGRELYRRNLMVYFKERIFVAAKRLGIRK